MLKNNKGFAVTAMVYGMMTIASLIMFLTLDVMSSNKNISREFADDVEDELNKCSYYQGTCYDWHDEPTRGGMLVSEIGKSVFTIGRDYTKSRQGDAIVALVRYTGGDGKTYLGPLLVGTTYDSVVYRTTYDGKECTGNIGSFDYRGATYFYSSNYNYMEVSSSSTWISDYPVINDIMNKGEDYSGDENGQKQAAKDLLDYYYS